MIVLLKELIHQYGAWIVFALVFLESIGLPLPREAILVSAAIFAGTMQDLSIALVLLSAVLGAILGSTIGFWIGGRYGYPLLLRYGSCIGLTETRIKIAQYLFRRQGMVVVLILSVVAASLRLLSPGGHLDRHYPQKLTIWNALRTLDDTPR